MLILKYQRSKVHPVLFSFPQQHKTYEGKDWIYYNCILAASIARNREKIRFLQTSLQYHINKSNVPSNLQEYFPVIVLRE